MKYSKKIFVSIFWLILGVVLNICYFCGLIEEYWSGMGFGFIFVGLLQVVRHIKYANDKEYREQVDIEIADERNKYLSSKAWAWAGYCFVLISAIGSLILKILGYEEYSLVLSFVMCLMLILYWGSWFILKRKY